MYLIYVANDVDVKVLAGQWGQEHTKLPNGTVQAIHSALSKTTWQDAIRAATVKRNPRITHLSNATPDDIPAIELTGMMHDAGFQCIGWIADETADAVAKAQKEAQVLFVNTLLDHMREDMLASIEATGVMDRISHVGSKVQYSFSAKTNAKDVRETMANRKAFINEYLAKAVDLESMVTLSTGI